MVISVEGKTKLGKSIQRGLIQRSDLNVDPKNWGEKLPMRRMFHAEERNSCGKGHVLGSH